MAEPDVVMDSDFEDEYEEGKHIFSQFMYLCCRSANIDNENWTETWKCYQFWNTIIRWKGKVVLL